MEDEVVAARPERYVIVDVGCIECGEQTEVLGIFDDEASVEAAFDTAAKAKNVEGWSPRGGMLEWFGLYQHTSTTYVGGVGYFSGGQHALEVHVFPPRPIAIPEESAT